VNRIIISLYFSQQQQRRRSKSFSVDFPFPSCVLFPSPAHRREHFAAQSTTTPALSLLLLYKSPPFILFPLFLPHPPSLSICIVMAIIELERKGPLGVNRKSLPLFGRFRFHQETSHHKREGGEGERIRGGGKWTYM
jgi:hypothetical protein